MNKLIKLLEEVLECELNEDSDSENCEEWDSMNHVNIILELQDTYEIKISSTEIDKLKSVKMISNYLQLHGKM